MYYFTLFLILVVFALIDIFTDNKRIKDMLMVLAYLLLLFTSGFRYETGVDWRAYSVMLDVTFPIDKLNTAEGYDSVFGGIDVGFKLLISVIKYFGGGLQTLFFITAFISTTFLSASLKRYLKFPILGLVIYYGMIYFYLDMSGMRQATSLAIFFYSVRYIQERRPLKYFGLLFIAFTFHWSTLFLFPLYWAVRLRVNKILVGTVLAAAILLYFTGIKWVTSLVPVLFTILQNTNFADKVVVYSTVDIFANSRGTTVRDILHVFFLLSTLFFSVRYKEQLAAKSKYYIIFHKLLVLQVLIYFLFYEFPELAERIKLYFYISNIIVLPSFLLLAEHQVLKKMSIAFVLFAYALFYGNVHILEKPFAIAYSPYQNYIFYEIFDLQSTGELRLNQHIANTEETVK